MINSRKIEDLNPKMKVKWIELVDLLLKHNIKVKVTCTLRDAEYQKSLYAQGRTKPGKKVTNVDGIKSKSKHQSGMAVDFVLINSKGECDWNDIKTYKLIADLAKTIGLTPGYYFKLVDACHIELN